MKKNKKNILLLILVLVIFVSLSFNKVTYFFERKEYYASKQEVEEFIKEWAVLAQEDMKTSGIYASLTIAQAALESGWGTSDLSSTYYNYFGRKRGTSNDICSNFNEKFQGDKNSVWAGVSICLKASEGGGAYFRVYDNAKQSLQDRNRNFWCSKRYEEVVHATTLLEQLYALASSGYRTGYETFDAYYYNKIAKIINDYDLTQYDEEITFKGGKPSYASSCSTTEGTSFTGQRQEFIEYTEEYNYLNLNTGYSGDLTKGYIYTKYSDNQIWNQLGTDADEEIVDIIIGNIFLQGEKLYGDGKLHFTGLLTDGTNQTAPGSGVIGDGTPLSCYSYISSNFDDQESFRKSKHKGLDLAAPRGTQIFSVTDGVVTAAYGNCQPTGFYGSTCGGGYGNHVKVKAADGTIYIYAHMNHKPSVSVNSTVQKGQVLGVVGSSGSSTGPHLHFEVKVNGSSVNPIPYANVDRMSKCS